MVLWEITLATAYFLGLKRTFKLAMKTQRHLISRKHPRTREFLRRRTRAVFDVAVNVHKKIQTRDIEVGRNLGNWMLRWLDRMKPSAGIHKHPTATATATATATGMEMIKKVSNSYAKHRASPRSAIRQKFDRYMSITSPLRRWPTPFPTISMLMRQPKPAGTTTQHRQFSSWGSEAMKTNHRGGRFDHVIREDIMQWMLRK